MSEGQVKTWKTKKNVWHLTHEMVDGKLKWSVERQVDGGWVELGSWVQWKRAIDAIITWEVSNG